MTGVTESNTLKLELKNYADLALLALSPPFLYSPKNLPFARSL